MRASVPYYAAFACLDDVPAMTKAIARESGEALLNTAIPRKYWIRKKTGGSTGEPLVYFTSRQSQSHLWAGILLSWTAAGYKIGDRVALLAGSAIFGDLSWKHHVYYRLMNFDLYSAFELSESTMEQYLQTMVRRRPKLIYGYAAAIYRLARFASQSGMKVPGVRACVTTAEVLTPRMRTEIERGLGCEVFNQYGANDAGVSAFECEKHRGMHLITSRCHYEVTKEGRLLATDLTNDVMPLFRYDTGDMVTIAKTGCDCGRGYPLIEAVEGRANDCVRAPDGKWVHSEFFTHMFREDPCIDRFQVLQRRDGAIEIRLESKGMPDVERYDAAIRRRLGSTPIEWKNTADFILTSGGKVRFVISDIPQDAESSARTADERNAV
jgi:phenylacetate-CoA ligase